MVRQYIGSRYVPKFYDYEGSSEWRSGTAYEALTIVTRNGNSYTSKKPVPSTVGAPEDNPTYWASTGIYNEQIEEYRQVTAEVASGLSTLSETVSGIGTSVNTLRSDTNLLMAENRRFVFVADSYGMRVTPSYIDRIKSYMGLSDSACYNLAFSGGGFARPGNKFITVLQGASGTITNHNTITDIVVGGGFNDANYFRNGTITANDIVTEMNNFATYCKSEYPNARLWLHFDAYCNDVLANDTTIGTNGEINLFIGRTERLYASGGRFGYRYMNNVKYTLHDTSLLDETYFHPNETGNVMLASNIMSYLNGGDCSVTNGSVVTFTPASGMTLVGSAPVFVQEIHDGVATLSFGQSTGTYFTTYDGAFNLYPAGTPFEIGTLTSNQLLFCGSRQYSAAIPVMLYNSTSEAVETVSATIFMARGKLYLSLISESNEWTRIFIGGGNITLPTMGADNDLRWLDA